jgi:hypothetical protein
VCCTALCIKRTVRGGIHDAGNDGRTCALIWTAPERHAQRVTDRLYCTINTRYGRGSAFGCATTTTGHARAARRPLPITARRAAGGHRASSKTLHRVSLQRNGAASDGKMASPEPISQIRPSSTPPCASRACSLGRCPQLALIWLTAATRCSTACSLGHRAKHRPRSSPRRPQTFCRRTRSASPQALRRSGPPVPSSALRQPPRAPRRRHARPIRAARGNPAGVPREGYRGA